jgi:hypothetical protein
MLAYFLQCASRLNSICGRNDVAREYQSVANMLKKNTKKYFYDKKTGLFADDLNHKYYSQQMQTWCVLSGTCKGDLAKSIMENSQDLEAKATYAFAYFYFRALEVVGLYEKTETMMDSYRGLLKLNCTTVPETPEYSRSDCHAWGALAIYEFSATVLGVRTENVFEKSVSVKPYVKGRAFAKGTVSTIAGDVYVSWSKDGDNFTITVESDDDVKKTIYMPDGTELETDIADITLTCKLKKNQMK